jgi:hypothetical protein
VNGVEDKPEQMVSTPGRLVQGSPGTFVIAEVDDYSGFAVNTVRPVRVIEAGRQNDQLRIFSGSKISESPLVTDPDQRVQWVVASVPRTTAFIDGIDRQVRRAKFGYGVAMHDAA